MGTTCPMIHFAKRIIDTTTGDFYRRPACGLSGVPTTLSKGQVNCQGCQRTIVYRDARGHGPRARRARDQR